MRLRITSTGNIDIADTLELKWVNKHEPVVVQQKRYDRASHCNDFIQEIKYIFRANPSIDGDISTDGRCHWPSYSTELGLRFVCQRYRLAYVLIIASKSAYDRRCFHFSGKIDAMRCDIFSLVFYNSGFMLVKEL